MDVLLIAPDAPGQRPITWTNEISEIANIEGVNYTLVGGKNATKSRVAMCLRQKHDIVVWAGHGQPDKLLLSDNTTVGGGWVATQARKGNPRAMIMAACYSAEPDVALRAVTRAISRAGVNAIGMKSEIEDKPAYTFTTEFVRAMMADADVGESYDCAIEAVMDLPEDNADDQAAMIELVGGITNGYRGIVDRIDQMDHRLESVERKIDGISSLLSSKLNA
jgi:hypothetical protein